MKHILILMSFVSLLIGASSFASADYDDQLMQRIEMMVSVAKKEKNIITRKMIVSNAVQALAKSNIKNAKLSEAINDEVYSISASFTKRERAILNMHLAKIQ